ncbi:MAG: 30S ribosomal protein S4e [Candidatus Helarchaeota archaeon]
MGKKGQSKHLKRYPAPKYWPIHRKINKYTVRASPGPHPMKQCIPLILIMRELFNFVETAKEGKIVIKEGNIKIDGKVRKNPRFPVGLMDVIEFPKINKVYRILPIRIKGLLPHPITEEEKNFKLCKITNKTLLKKGKIQLNLHDGRNLIIDDSGTNYKTKDVLKISLPDQELLEHYPFKEDMSALVIAGRHVGAHGILKKIEHRFGPHASVVTIEHEGITFQTALEYAFIIGEKSPVISLFE